MPPGQSSWIRRSVGLALSWHLLRRALAVRGAAGEAALATVISAPGRELLRTGPSR